MQGSTIKTDRRKIVRPTDFQFCLEIPGPRTRIFTPPPGTRPGFPHTILCLVTGAEFAQREFFEGALPVALAGSFAAELAIEQRLAPMAKTIRITCNFTERRNGSSSAIGHDMVSAMSSRLIPSKCSIFSSAEKCRHPRGRSATRGM
jgi:hypothetical protein